LTLNSQINTAFQIRGFLRYGLENYDTVRAVNYPGQLFEFDARQSFRLGVNGEYAISQKMSIFGGVDYLPSKFNDGRQVADDADLATPPAPATVSGLSEDLVNAYIGLSMKLTNNISGDISYNYTYSNSDLFGNNYNRNRINVGLRAEF
jgi:hypothetical protein